MDNYLNMSDNKSSYIDYVDFFISVTGLSARRQKLIVPPPPPLPEPPSRHKRYMAMAIMVPVPHSKP